MQMKINHILKTFLNILEIVSHFIFVKRKNKTESRQQATGNNDLLLTAFINA